MLSRSDCDRIFAKLLQIWRKYSVVIVIITLCDREKKTSHLEPGYTRVVLYGKSWSKSYIGAVLLNNGASLMFQCSKILFRCCVNYCVCSCCRVDSEVKLIKNHFTFCWKRRNFGSSLLWNFAFRAWKCPSAKILLSLKEPCRLHSCRLAYLIC